MEKRLFQILDEMNQQDEANKTQMVAICNSFISADKVKDGAKIGMGAPEEMLYEIMNGKKIPILVLVDKEEYFKRKNVN